MLSHLGSNSPITTLYEPLPSYLQRQGFDVNWITNNWGEPKINVKSYVTTEQIKSNCKTDCKNLDYDEAMLYSIKTTIQQSLNKPTLFVLHQSGSHGPSYYKKYPQSFEKFTPSCKSVELKNCTKQELTNSYDNTIVYTDYFLHQLVGILQSFKNIPSVVIYVSDHGESLGEYNIYLHGTPYSIAPSFQKDIPFIIWVSEAFKKQNPSKYKSIIINTKSVDNNISHDNVFHTVVGAFNADGGGYNRQFDLFNNYE
jgi:lipid A ethanolaminephosphotransferase